MTNLVYRNGPIFDGHHLHTGKALAISNGLVQGLVPPTQDGIDLEGDLLCPGFVDLQVNGGGGVMFNDAPSVETLATMAEAHRNLGATSILPTLITDTPEVTRAAIAATEMAFRQGVPGIAGLHLEGPHLSIARKGAHDPDLIRPMEQSDVETLLDAAGKLPSLLVTVAPENTTVKQVQTLVEAGILVSLGHSDTDHDTARRYARAGARAVTHLFNAMSPLGHREPGLVGAALADGGVSAGLIADGIHVHPEAIRAAWAAKRGPGQIFLVSDAMATAGSNIEAFTLNGREILRRDGRLTLADGTLAGADLDLGRAVRLLVETVGLPLETALAAATSVPARLAGLPPGVGEIRPGTVPTLIRLNASFEVVAVYSSSQSNQSELASF